MDTKQALLESAERAVRRWGYNGFSYADLSKDVGIRKASIHYYFPKKENLALALIAQYRETVFDRLNKISDGHGKASQQIEAFIEVYRNALGACDMVCLCVALSGNKDDLNEATLKEVNRFQDGIRNWLISVFNKAQNDKSISNLLESSVEAANALALVQGAQLVARASGEMTSFDNCMAALSARLS